MPTTGKKSTVNKSSRIGIPPFLLNTQSLYHLVKNKSTLLLKIVLNCRGTCKEKYQKNFFVSLNSHIDMIL